ncbi:MAG: hypothetical protein ACYTEZ_07570 [Planctomycetota bacterium]|jgi:hypothetical protein
MNVSTVTTTDGSLLRSIRTTLRDADRALLCVAFATVPGVHLLAREFRLLRSRASLLVTTMFGTTTPAALAMAAETGVRVALFNPGAGQTYHPKIYLGRRGNQISAVVGSANLTGGLVTNVEAACHLEGDRSYPSLRGAWAWARGLWEDDRVQEWTPQIAEEPPEVLEELLYAYLKDEVARNNAFYTLGPRRRKNEVTELTESGLYVETGRSRERSTGPQLIPAWMLNLAWDYLRAHGTLSNRYLLDDLHIHRSSAVCAILARHPSVRRRKGPGIVLEWVA